MPPLAGRYLGDRNNQGSVSTAVTQAVSFDPTSIVITSDTNPAIVDVDFTLTITVVPAAPGGGNFSHDGPQNVALFINGTQVSDTLRLNESGSATYITSLNTPGEAAITAGYGGDFDQFYSSQSLQAFEQDAEYYSPPPPPPPPPPRRRRPRRLTLLPPRLPRRRRLPRHRRPRRPRRPRPGRSPRPGPPCPVRHSPSTCEQESGPCAGMS